MSFKTKLYINGEWRGSSLYFSLTLYDIMKSDPIHGGTFNTINPANGEVITPVAAATAEDVDGRESILLIK
jgi:acyl-CoA reductase-like NAD-dependent aldehyde dehydrogenase